ncbi:MAG: type VI secretion system contractile sheath small subunit [Chlorobi bacterium]|jgi:type VI secretion system protein ImpB|nr:type VI secretion system contractile sheath small subunit [Chlorobiota bacterium]
MPDNTQRKLTRVRPPRVQITYDVETNGAIQQKELPFVVGVFSDLAGTPKEPLPEVKKRKFIEIDRDNFNRVMNRIRPRVVTRVENKLQDDGSEFAVDLEFRSMDDFNPAAIAKKVEPLRQLLELRQKLVEMIAKLDGNNALYEQLESILSNTEALQRLAQEAQSHGTGAGEQPPTETEE